jgi:hypothetical protein
MWRPALQVLLCGLFTVVVCLASPVAVRAQDGQDDDGWAVAGYDERLTRIAYQSGFPTREAASREAPKMRLLEGTNGKIYPYVTVLGPDGKIYEGNLPSSPPRGPTENRPVQPRPSPTPTPRVVTLPNTTWKGGETLQNYGELRFQFGSGDTVSMKDSDGTTTGQYSRSGRTVTLRFYNGTVVYTGTLDDNIIHGTGRNGRTSWTFSVKLQ